MVRGGQFTGKWARLENIKLLSKIQISAEDDASILYIIGFDVIVYVTSDVLKSSLEVIDQNKPHERDKDITAARVEEREEAFNDSSQLDRDTTVVSTKKPCGKGERSRMVLGWLYRLYLADDCRNLLKLLYVRFWDILLTKESIF